MLVRALLMFVLLTAPAFADRVVVMRGKLDDSARTNVFEYVGDETSLARATMGGLNGEEVVGQNREKLRAQVELYQAAQRAAGVNPPKPLYVLINPDGTWVYARFGRSFTLVHPGGRREQVAEGFIDLGEKVDYMTQAHDMESARESNRALLDLVNEHYKKSFVTRDHKALIHHLFAKAPCARTLPQRDEAWPAQVKRLRGVYQQLGCDLATFDAAVAEFERANPGTPESFETVINRRMRFSIPGQTARTFSVYADHLPHAQFVEELSELVSADLTERAVADPAALLGTQEARDITSRHEKRARIGGLNAALTHEIGHLIHHRAGTGFGFGPVRTGLPGDPGEHYGTTLSNPGFALVEGFAEATAYTFAQEPTARDRQLALEIDYNASMEALQAHLNDALLQKVGAALRAKNLLRENTIPIEGEPLARQTPADFERALKVAAKKLGLPDADFDAAAAAVRSDPALASARRRYAFTSHLQAHKGERKKRADFLSSEASVAYTLHELNKSLGGKFFERALALFRDVHPEGLAPLLEAYVARYPQERAAVYQTLARVTDGVLITPAQVEAVGRNAALHIDLDRDGKTPGESANAKLPEAFPPESNTFGPVPELEGHPLPLTGGDAAARIASASITAVPEEVALPVRTPRARVVPAASVPDDSDLRER
jgi:hypothetical protein